MSPLNEAQQGYVLATIQHVAGLLDEVGRLAAREATWGRRVLESPGCPACRARDFSDERLMYALVTEHYADAATLDELRASVGPCPAHARRLLDQVQAPYVLRAVYAAAVAGALAAEPVTDCPLCRRRTPSELTTARVVASALAAPAVIEAYAANGGFCFPHACATLPDASRNAVRSIIQVLDQALASANGETSLVTRLAGLDPDAPLRKEQGDRPLVELGDGETGPRTTLEALHLRLAAAACPICLAAGLMERRYLQWLIEEQRLDPRALRVEGLWLCPAHLHDLQAESLPAATCVATLMRERVRDELARLRDALAAAPRFFPRLRRLLTPLLRDRPCSACDAAAAAEERERALLLAALHDAPTTRRYEAAHGLCARHVRALPERAAEPRRVLRARLLVLAWELEEAGRKSSWQARHEPSGPERTAWRRAAAQLDGRVFCALEG